MKFLDLFSGIGGFRLGFEQQGFGCVGFCEKDEFARKSYKAIHNSVTVDVVREIAKRIKEIEI